MVLNVVGDKKAVKFKNLYEFFREHKKTYESSAEAFHSLTERKISGDTPRCLYICQNEFAVIDLKHDESPAILGSDEATTCHLIALLSRRNQILAFGHVDGRGISSFLSDVIRLMRGLGDDLSDGVDTYMVGGFLDDRNDSEKICSDLLRELAKSKVTFYLQLAVVLELNSEFNSDENIFYPRRYGVAIDLESTRKNNKLDIYPANFQSNGPSPQLRNCRFCCSKDEMANIYNPYRNIIEIKPFDYSRIRGLEKLVNAPDEILKQYSTSPQQEREGYAQKLRETFQFMLQYPYPKEQIFKGSPLRYRVNSETGQWDPLND